MAAFSSSSQRSLPPEQICCFTGHRTLPLRELPAVRSFLNRGISYLFQQRGVTRFRAGGALGFDTLAAEVVLSLRETCPAVELELILPCPEQDARWTPEDRERYTRIRQQAQLVSYTSEAYFRGCMLLRNRQLVNGAGWCLAYLRRSTGGTAYTVRYAREQGLQVFLCPRAAQD